ncbi:GTP-binding protein ypt2 [Elsinoe australis]|uniref:GTP-binding protein ypt2 n=1 Tax=Elsinoe australis TaxID=40998 RepID=A0A2P8AI79_9PEZI|nr:GTP-binding protein ypt2 [Elsinoe australis]
MWSIKSLFTSSLLLSSVIAEDVLISRRNWVQRKRDETFDLTYFHINDVHAHLDEFRASQGTDCQPAQGCVGGYARVKTVLNDLRPQAENSLFLDAGDEFQGTLFYNFYKGEKTAEVLNQIGVDAMTLGNHEFDGGDDELGAFLANLTFPVVSANIKSTHPILNATIKPYVIFDKYELAVIGVTIDSSSLSNPGNGTTFADPITTVQNTIDHIRATTNIKRIAALTHIGYDEDQRLAAETTGLSLIMGGHSHTPLGNITGSQGPYPTIVENKDGDEVFVVTAYRWGEYLGYIDLKYDSNGKVLEYRGAPIRLTNATIPDPQLYNQIKGWRAPFEEFAAEVVGETRVELVQNTCQSQECTLGDFMADAMLAYRRNVSANVAFAIINAGGIRATIDVGPVTRGEVLTAFPFGNAIVELTRTGQEIYDVLEGIVSKVNTVNGRPVTSFFQLSTGIRVEYNPNNAVGSRLVSVTIGDAPIDLAANYDFVTLDYLAGGGDNFFQSSTDFITLDLQADVLTAYLATESPVNFALDGRITSVAPAMKARSVRFRDAPVEYSL